MDWADLPPGRVRQLERLAACDPLRMRARLEGAFALRHSDAERCSRIAHTELELAEARGNRHAAAVAWVVIAYAGPLTDPVQLLAELQNAHEVLKEVGDTHFQIRASDLLATIYEGMGDYPTALQYTQSTLRLCREIGDRLFEAYGLSSLAGILTAAEDVDGAMDKLEVAWTIAAELKIDRLHSRLLVRLGRVERQRGMTEQAIEHFRHAHTIAKKSLVRYTEADALGEIGRTFEQQGDLKQAEDVYEQALALMDEEMRALVGPGTMLGIARICLKTDRVERAVQLVNELGGLAARFYMVPVQCDATKLLADAYRQLGDFENAFGALSEHLHLKDTITRGEAQRAVKRLQVKADLEAARKDAEIHRLRYVELATLQTQLVESERLAAIGNLTAGLTHEMNTPLGAVRSSLDTTRRALDRMQDALPKERARSVQTSTDALRAAEATSRSAVERLENLVDSLRRFTRLDEADYQSLDLADGLEATINILSLTLAPGIRIERRLQPVPRILGWPGALNQAFLTLLNNAAEALNGSGTIRVATDMAHREAGGVVVRIADDGPGIPADIKERLFDMELSRDGTRAHFRTGLASVRSIVKRHHGHIELWTEPGQGTEFALIFPR